MKIKKLIILIIIVLVLLGILGFVLIFRNNTAKKLKIGNNTTSQEIVDYILNISSYEATIEVKIESNKNDNKYKIKQIYKGKEENSQEVLEPSNIAGVKIIKNGNTLKLENSNLNLTTIIEDYEYVTDNCLDLNSFVR